MVSNKFLAGIAALVCAAHAQAVPTSLIANVTEGDYFVSGAGKSYDINVNSLLSSKGLSSSAISFGQLTVFGHSDAAYGLNFDDFSKYKYTGYTTHYNSGACNHGNCNVVDYVYTRTGTTYSYDLVSDTMKVTVGGASGSDTSEWQESLSDYSKLDRQDGSARWGWDYYQSIGKAYHGSYSGDLSVTLSLDSKALADIMQDGILSLSIWGGSGQFNVDSLRLNLLADVPTTPTESKVPVPTSLLLTGLGLAALATVRRRKA